MTPESPVHTPQPRHGPRHPAPAAPSHARNPATVALHPIHPSSALPPPRSSQSPAHAPVPDDATQLTLHPPVRSRQMASTPTGTSLRTPAAVPGTAAVHPVPPPTAVPPTHSGTGHLANRPGKSVASALTPDHHTHRRPTAESLPRTVHRHYPDTPTRTSPPSPPTTQPPDQATRYSSPATPTSL